MAHLKRVINFALFFMPTFNVATIGCSLSSPGQIAPPQDKAGHPLPPVKI